jgi:hypothetical protein
MVKLQFFVLFGTMLFVRGAHSAQNNVSTPLPQSTAVGNVVGLVPDPKWGAGSYFLQVAFTTPEGQAVTLTPPISYDKALLPKLGSQVTVYYDPGNPKKTKIVFGGTNATPVPTPPSGKKWITYTDTKYGFSFQYLSGDADRPVLAGRNAFEEVEITIPTLYEKGPIHLFGFTETSVEKWNRFAQSPENDGDGEAFAFPFQKLQQALQTPVGSECDVYGNGRIVNFNGAKVFLRSFDEEEGSGLEKEYFIPRGGTRWLGITVRSYESDRNPAYDEAPLTPELREKEKDATEVVLRTFKFFEPTVK